MYTTTNTKPKHTKKPQTPSTHFDFSIFFFFCKGKNSQENSQKPQTPSTHFDFSEFFPLRKEKRSHEPHHPKSEEKMKIQDEIEKCTVNNEQ